MNHLATPDELESLLSACVEGTCDPAQTQRIERLIDADPAALDAYVEMMSIHAMLQWRYAEQPAAEAGSRQSEVGSGQSAVGDDPPSALRPPPSPNPQSLIPNPSPAPFIVVDHTLPSPFSPLPSFLFSYTVATIIFGIAGLCGWLYQVEHYTEFARSFGTMPAAVEEAPPAVEQAARVGRITGMVDVKWEKQGLGIRDWGLENQKSFVSLGDTVSLASGLLQLTYDSGAKVILQGPCTYEVDSAAGGYLSLGKLTAKVESGEWRVESGEKQVVSGQWSVVSKSNIQHPTSNISNPQSLIPNPSLSPFPLPPSPFVVKTPTAVVTDLGTEFGVEVDKAGLTAAHVFRGSIRMQPTSNDGQMAGDGQVLHENESAQVEVDRHRNTIVRRIALRAEEFARHMPDAPPVVLLSDTFDNRVDSTVHGEAGGYGLNKDLSHRQSGLYRPVYYQRGGDYVDLNRGLQLANSQVNHLLCPGRLCLFADYGRAGWVVLMRRFPRDVAVSAELTPVAVHWPDKSRPETFYRDYDSVNWIALGVRGRGVWFDRNLLPLASDSGAVFLIRTNGGWEYFENGQRKAVGNVSAGSSYRVIMQVVGDRLAIRVNDVPLQLDANEPVGARRLRGWAAKTKDNFISFGACNAISLGGVNVSAMFNVNGRDLSTVDNLTIATVGPEALAASEGNGNGENFIGKEVPRNK